MVRARHNPRKGSIAYRPRVRARKQTPSFRSFPIGEGPTKPLNFFGYKAGMVHVLAQSQHPKGRRQNMDIQIPTTVIECPPLQVWGVRAYTKNAYGLHAHGELTVDKLEKGAQKRIPSFKKKYPHKRNTEKKTVSREKLTFEQLDTQKEALHCLRLLVHTHPEKVGFGKKKAEIAEVALSGTVEEQLAYAKEKMGKTIAVSEIFEANEDVDVRAVTRGFGFGGVVARFGVKTFRPKAKYIRAVGSISPLRPKTVMFTVARPGQLGYHNRTEFNKRILTISDDAKKINPKSGFMHYGVIQNEYMLLAGSVPGPVKRLIGLRTCVRPQPRNDYRIGNITITSSTAGAV